MITHLKLTKFKRHEALEVNFESGLTAMGGANEAGKSSVLHALLYLIGGARLLPLSLDETVTWGSPASALRVEGTFRFGGAEYRAYRAKSGAELVGPGFLSVGQSEVTSKFEELIGAPANLIAKLLIANQKALGGVLDDGAGATKLIEELAGLDVIEVLIDKVQTQLPTGATTALVSTMATLQETQMPDAAAVQVAEQALGLAQVRRDEASREVDQAQGCVDAYDEATLRRAERDYADMTAEVGRLTQAIDKPMPAPMVVSLQDLDVLQAAWDAQKQDKVVRAAWDVWQRAGLPVAPAGDMPVGDATAAPALEVKIAQLQATRPETGDTCGHCGSRLCLSEEAVHLAADVDRQIADLRQQAVVARAAYRVYTSRMAEWQKAHAAWAAYNAAISKVGQFAVDGVWVGPAISSEVDTTDYGRLIRDQNEKRQRMAAHAALVAQAAQQKAEAKEALLQLQPAFEYLASAAEAARGNLQALEAVKRHLRSKQFDLTARDASLQLASRDLSEAQLRYRMGVQAYESAQAQVVRLQAAIAAQEANNSLIKKLRTARPLVAAKLWASLLGSISRIFSDLRGEPSQVEKGASGFTVNGKPAAAFSGSTLDILGLAIRVSLLRAFLPGLSMLVLDEPSAAMDSSREEVMLGLLAQLGLDQVLVVSHSDAVKAVATNVVEL